MRRLATAVLVKFLTNVPLVGAPFDPVCSFRAMLDLWIELLILQELHETRKRHFDVLAHDIHRLAVEFPVV